MCYVLFTIDALDDEMIVSFCYSCKREQQLYYWLINTSCYNFFDVYLLIILYYQR